MESKRATAIRLAEEHHRVATAWWAAFDKAIHRSRSWNVKLALRRCLRARARNAGATGIHLEALKRSVEEAYDLGLIEDEQIETCAGCARSAEMMARIYSEEADEHLGPERWQFDG